MRRFCFVLWLLPLIVFSQKQYEVFFDFNKDYPNQASMEKWNQWIAANKTVEVTGIFGYCDSVDDSNYNRELAMRRINFVMTLLKKEAIAINDKVELKPFGKDFKFSKKQEENRKVTFFYTSKEEKTKENKEIAKTDEAISSFDSQALIEKEASQLAVKFQKAKKGDLIKINNINFLFNSERIEERSRPILEKLVQIMLDNPKLRIAIHGHICCNPNVMDTKLSYRRALVIFNYLRDNGVELSRLSYKGFGSNDPIYKLPERNEAERKANRRVEILIVDK